MGKFDCATCPSKKASQEALSKTQLFAICFVIAALSFGIGFIVSYHHYQEPAKISPSRSGQHYYSSKTYTLDLQSQMPFGKHKGKTLQHVIDEEPGYVRWMRREVQRVSFSEEVLQRLEKKKD